MFESLVTALVVLLRYGLVFVEAAVMWGLLRRVRRGSLRFGSWFTGPWAWLSARRVRATVATVLLVWAGRLALLAALPVREPQVTDEFSYLLAADTFAHGRVANAAPPFWQHFEAPHVLVTPTYASMYLPGQGLVLALGQALGHPWIGVWLVTGLMAGALVWALQGWLPSRWATLAGVLVAVRLGWFSYWMNSYWGGAPAALGGALAVGAAARLRRRPRWRDAVWLGLGLTLTMYTRPYEGLFLGLGLAAILIPRWNVRLLASATLVLAAAVGVLYYFDAVTGSPLTPPEVVQRKPYAVAGVFFWDELRPNPGYRHRTLEDFYAVFEVEVFAQVDTPMGLLVNRAQHAVSVWLFYLGPLLTPPLLFLPWILRDRRTRPLLIAGSIAASGSLLSIWFYPHYLAPACAILYVLVVQGVRHLAVWRRHERAGWQVATALPAVCGLMVAIRLAVLPFSPLNPPDWPMTWFSSGPGNTTRAAMKRQLEQMPGRHIALVRYGARDAATSVMDEWVYNGADLDGSKAVFAHEMDEVSTARLLDYYRDRTAWLIEPDARPPRLTPYPR